MAQYLVFFNKYRDLNDFDGSNESCLFVGPITMLSRQGKAYLSPFGTHKDEVVTELVLTEYNPPNYRVGNELFATFMVFSEDVPKMKQLISMAENGTRLISYSEYGFLNHVKYAKEGVTIGILTPNSKKVEAYLKEFCPAKAMQNMNPTHPAVVIYKKFDQWRKSYIIIAHTTPAPEIGQELIEWSDAWFNYITQQQKLFSEDGITELSYNALFDLDGIARMG